MSHSSLRDSCDQSVFQVKLTVEFTSSAAKKKDIIKQYPGNSKG